MKTKRKLINTYAPKAAQGFLGNGHLARALIQGGFRQSDPFIMLMDDMLDKQDGEPAGGPHPHAGFETVTLVLEGEIGDTRHTMKQGDFQVMTAGSGIVHAETIDTKKKLRILQLWLNLPKKDRWANPRVQDLSFAHAPLVADTTSSIRVYSGSFAGVTSPISNYVPLIVADIRLAPNSTIVHDLPASYNAFLYVIEGSLMVGGEKQALKETEMGWLDNFPEEVYSELKLSSSEKGARVILYAGLPTGDSIVSHGPFIGDTQEDILRLYKEYRLGHMQHIANASGNQEILL
jgi:redox-sensitive bicupin YhaK (pirin superfamily)